MAEWIPLETVGQVWPACGMGATGSAGSLCEACSSLGRVQAAQWQTGQEVEQ